MSSGFISRADRDRLGMSPDDWKRHDEKTEAEITAAALADPDAQPITATQLPLRAVSKVVRNKLGMTRLRFSEAYGIPLEALRAWELRESEPTPTELAYLKLIEREPEVVKVRQAEPAT